jgi:2-dehydropantoate 2-reductase
MVSVCIFGGGAIGGYIAAHLARANQCAVNVIARGETLAAIRANGVRVDTPNGMFVARVNATDDPANLGEQDYIFLTLKAQQLDAALPSLAPLIGPRTTILPPTTGLPHYFFHGLQGPYQDRQLDLLDEGGKQWRLMPPAQVLGVVYWIGAHGVGPGAVRQDGANAGCPIGELDGAHSPRVTMLAQLLSDSGINARVRDNIRGDIWIKFVNSLCWNPVAVLTMARMGEMSGADGVVPVVRKMMEEADAIGARLGLAIPYPPEKRIAVTLGAPEHKMSMLQDFEHGRSLELEVLARSIRAVSELTGLPTPTLDTVIGLAQLRAATARSNQGNE